MKRIFRYTAIVIALSLAASCNVIEDKSFEGGLIRFEPQSVETKAMVNPDNVTSEKFAVWDLLGTTVHIQNYISYSGGNWAYQDPANATYYWKDGTHKFFGYTYNYSNATFDQSNWTWNIGTTAITTTANQTDLLYSSIFTTTAENWKTTGNHTKDSRVPLTFHHLLSALRITMVNASGTNVTVTDASVSLPNSGSASVSFANATAATTYTVTATPATYGSFSSQALSAGDSLDVLNGAKLSAQATPYLIWPQTIVEKTAESTANSATITFSLAYGNNAATEMSVAIPAGTWTAGEINNYRLLIYPDNIKLVFEVQPWEKVQVDPIDTPTGSINMSNVSWTNTPVQVNSKDTNTVVINSYLVNMFYHPTVDGTTYTANNGYFPAQGFFTVNYPVKGKFKIGLIPAYGQTEADLNAEMYEIWIWDETVTPHVFRQMKGESQGFENLDDWREYDGTTLKGVNTIYFQVRASNSVPNGTHPEYKAQIDIWFLPYGESEWISAYSEIRANYALVIPAR